MQSYMPKTVFGFMWKYMSKLKKLYFLVLITIFVGEIFLRVSLYYGAEIIQLISSDASKDDILRQAMVYAWLASLFFFLQKFLMNGMIYLETRFLPMFVSKISRDLFDYASKHSTSFFAEEMAGNVSNKMKTIVDYTYSLYFNTLWGFIFPFFTTLITIVFVLYINAELGLLLFAITLLFVASVYKLNRTLVPYSEARAKAVSEQNGIMVDSISNFSLSKSFSNHYFERRHYFKSVKKASKAARREYIQFVYLYLLQGGIRTIMQAVFYICPIWYWYKGYIDIGEFVLIQSMIALLSNVYNNFTERFLDFFRLYGGINDGLKLLNRPYDVVDLPNAKELKVKNAAVRFDNVLYRYKGSNPLFENFNLEIKSGEKVGLVGHSGSGKSTLVKLLSRYYDIQAGRIWVGSQDISEVTQDSLRKNIALIPQDPSLFNRTIMENIRYGDTKSTDKQVYAAAKKAYIHDFIMSLPQGYNSKVGERGVMLSGGERQRIAIARAILKNAPILVLDEATSALDSASEKYIQDSMKELMKGKTVIVIAHRLSTLKEMDRIVVMSKGKVVEEGTHASLLRKKGQYHKFYEMQSQGFLNL